jgi:DtxR family Mn-dependent transcriptional regulator
MSQNNISEVTSTNQIADLLGIKPATVTSMLKKLREKELITYQRYGKVALTSIGIASALLVIRKHRLWESFLVNALHFTWDEVHEVAEQLEHIQSEKLINKLDAFLSFPKVDPHGDPIPDLYGNMPILPTTTMLEMTVTSFATIIAVKKSNPTFLMELAQIGIQIHTKVQLIAIDKQHQRVHVNIPENKEIQLPFEIASNLIIQTIS